MRATFTWCWRRKFSFACSKSQRTTGSTTRAFVKRVMLSWQEYQRVYGEKQS